MEELSQKSRHEIGTSVIRLLKNVFNDNHTDKRTDNRNIGITPPQFCEDATKSIYLSVGLCYGKVFIFNQPEPLGD